MPNPKCRNCGRWTSKESVETWGTCRRCWQEIQGVAEPDYPTFERVCREPLFRNQNMTNDAQMNEPEPNSMQHNSTLPPPFEWLGKPSVTLPDPEYVKSDCGFLVNSGSGEVIVNGVKIPKGYFASCRVGKDGQWRIKAVRDPDAVRHIPPRILYALLAVVLIGCAVWGWLVVGRG
jgi:hypothetical protein